VTTSNRKLLALKRKAFGIGADLLGCHFMVAGIAGADYDLGIQTFVSYKEIAKVMGHALGRKRKGLERRSFQPVPLGSDCSVRLAASTSSCTSCSKQVWPIGMSTSK
jgi:hypothetical protein